MTRVLAVSARSTVPVPSVAPSVASDDCAPAGSGVSPGIFSGQRCDPLAIRRKFPGQWRAFLHGHFRDHVEVAFVFSVDEKTARHWWAGTTGPQGWAVEFAHRTFPDAPQWRAAA